MSGDTKIKSMGAIPHKGGVGFRVWAPNAQQVSVIGTFNDWDGGKHPMRAEENGHWYADIAEAHLGDQYRYLLTTAKGEFKRIDLAGLQRKLRRFIAAPTWPPNRASTTASRSAARFPSSVQRADFFTMIMKGSGVWSQSTTDPRRGDLCIGRH